MSRRRNEKKKRGEEREALTRRQIEEREAKRAKRLKMIIAISLIAVLVISIIIGVVAAIIGALNSETINYETANLSQYVYISPDDYKDFLAEIKLDAVDDLAIDEAVMQSLAQYRELPENIKDTQWFFPDANTRLGIGDSVRLYYHGYTLDEDGNRDYFDGGSSIVDFVGDSTVDDTATETFIGEGKFISGFEIGLVGKNPSEYSTLSYHTDRAAVAGDYISITCNITPPDAKFAEEQVTLLIRLDESAETKYGIGFTSKFIGKTPGEKIDSFLMEDSMEVEGKTTFSNITFNGIIETGDNPLTVKVRFPVDYSDEDLAGSVAYFEMYVKHWSDRTIPEIDEEFIKEEMNLTVEEFNEYEGETNMDKYRSFIKEAVILADAESEKKAIEAVMWEVLIEKAVVKRVPRGEVLIYYNDYVSEVVSAYQSASSSGTAGTLDSYALTYLSLEPGDDWRQYLEDVAEDRIIEKLVFYYIIRAEGFVPEGDEFDELYEKTLMEYVVSYLEYVKKGTTPEDYDTIEEYNKAVSDATAMVYQTYDQAYMRENVIYIYGIDKVVGLADARVTRGPVFDDYTGIEFK